MIVQGLGEHVSDQRTDLLVQLRYRSLHKSDGPLVDVDCCLLIVIGH